MSQPDLPSLLTSIVPFLRTLDIKIEKIENGTTTASIASRPEILNHIGTIHTGAVYTLGESASGGVVLSIFGDALQNAKAPAFIVLKGATVSHKKAVAGDVSVVATLDGDPAEIRAAFDADGRVDFPIHVVASVGDVVVVETEYMWAVRAPRT